MEPEDGVKARIGNVAHVPAIAHEHMDAIMHILDAVVVSPTPVGEAYVGEWAIL